MIHFYQQLIPMRHVTLIPWGAYEPKIQVLQDVKPCFQKTYILYKNPWRNLSVVSQVVSLPQLIQISFIL
jgi:hypothetical protein